TPLEKIGLKHNKMPDKTGMELASVISQTKNYAIKSISFARNNLSDQNPCEMRLMYNKSGYRIDIDLEYLMEVKDSDRHSRTINNTTLPNDVTEQQIKK